MLTRAIPCVIISFACEHADNKAEQPLSPAGSAEQVQKSDLNFRSNVFCKRLTASRLFIWVFPEGISINNLFINEQIRDKEVRVIGEAGNMIGVMSTREALAMAQDAGLDLIKIAPGANPPVCKIADYGKYQYEQIRKEKEARKKQHQIEIKEIRISPNIDTNDVNTKINAARKFLAKGDKVKVTLRFRGREMAHMNTTKHVLDDFAEALSDVAVIEKPAKVEGRSIIMFLTAKKDDKPSKNKEEATQ